MEWRTENAAHEHPRSDAKVVLFLFTDRSHARRSFSGPQLPQAARRQAGDPGLAHANQAEVARSSQPWHMTLSWWSCQQLWA